MDKSQLLPGIVSFSPTLSDTNVGTLPSISTTFSTEIDQTQLNTDVTLNNFVLLVCEDSATSVSVHFVSYANRTLTFTPTASLAVGKTYQVTLFGKISTAAGRQMGANVSWSFVVAPSSVGTTTLLTPANSTAVAVNPVLSWNPVTVASTGTVFYLVEVDQTLEFATVATRGWSTFTPATSALPAPALSPTNTYFWRVTAVLVTAQGSVWGGATAPWAFYIGTFLQPSLSTEVLYPEAALFTLSSASFPNGFSDQQNWPPLVFVFSSAPSSASLAAGISFYRKPVDGNPTYAPGNVAFSYSLNGDTLTITPGEGIIINSRYTITFTGITDSLGNLLTIAANAPGQAASFYFTSHYVPLYIGLEPIRASFGHLLTDYSDDFINFHIYRSSLDVNRHWIRVFNPGWISAPTEQTVRGQLFMEGYAMERWVELDVSRRVLSEVLKDNLAVAAREKRLGNYQESVAADLIRYLATEIETLKKEANYWIAEFSKKRARPRTGRKSEYYPRWRENFDMSRWDRGLKEIPKQGG